MRLKKASNRNEVTVYLFVYQWSIKPIACNVHLFIVVRFVLYTLAIGIEMR